MIHNTPNAFKGCTQLQLLLGLVASTCKNHITHTHTHTCTHTTHTPQWPVISPSPVVCMATTVSTAMGTSAKVTAVNCLSSCSSRDINGCSGVVAPNQTHPIFNGLMGWHVLPHLASHALALACCLSLCLSCCVPH